MKTCYFCKGLIKEKKIEHIHRWQGKIYIFENIEAEVCSQCGEVYLKPDLIKMMDNSIKKHEKPIKSVSVPVFSLTA